MIIATGLFDQFLVLALAPLDVNTNVAVGITLSVCLDQRISRDVNNAIG